jgi:hypothetical protein
MNPVNRILFQKRNNVFLNPFAILLALLNHPGYKFGRRAISGLISSLQMLPRC